MNIASNCADINFRADKNKQSDGFLVVQYVGRLIIFTFDKRNLWDEDEFGYTSKTDLAMGNGVFSLTRRAVQLNPVSLKSQGERK